MARSSPTAVPANAQRLFGKRAPELPHATNPAVIVTGFSLYITRNVGMGENHEAALEGLINNNIGDLFRLEDAVNLIATESTFCGAGVVFHANHPRRDSLRANH